MQVRGKLLSLFGCSSNSVCFAALQLEHQKGSCFRSYGPSDTTTRAFRRDVSLQAHARSRKFHKSNMSATKCCKPVEFNAATQSRRCSNATQNHFFVQQSATICNAALKITRATATVHTLQLAATLQSGCSATVAACYLDQDGSHAGLEFIKSRRRHNDTPKCKARVTRICTMWVSC